MSDTPELRAIWVKRGEYWQRVRLMEIKAGEHFRFDDEPDTEYRALKDGVADPLMIWGGSIEAEQTRTVIKSEAL